MIRLSYWTRSKGANARSRKSKIPFCIAITMLNIKQIENEGLLDYVKRFKQSHDITTSHVETDILGKFMENTRLPQGVSRRSRCSKATRYERYSIWEMDGICQGKYSSLLNILESQFSTMENNQYPMNIARSATDILSNHRHDGRASYQGNRQQKKSSYITPRKGKETTHPPWPAARQALQKVAKIKLATAAVRRDTSLLNVLTRK